MDNLQTSQCMTHVIIAIMLILCGIVIARNTRTNTPIVILAACAIIVEQRYSVAPQLNQNTQYKTFLLLFIIGLFTPTIALYLEKLYYKKK